MPQSFRMYAEKMQETNSNERRTTNTECRPTNTEYRILISILIFPFIFATAGSEHINACQIHFALNEVSH